MTCIEAMPNMLPSGAWERPGLLASLSEDFFRKEKHGSSFFMDHQKLHLF